MRQQLLQLGGVCRIEGSETRVPDRVVPVAPPAAAVRGIRATSVEAGRRAVRRVGDVQRRILEQLATAPDGLTDEQIEQRLPSIRPATLRGRRAELVRAGLVVDTRRKRETSSRCLAVVWAAASNEARCEE